MIYRQEQAHEHLKDFVRCYWQLENTTTETLHYTILPDGFFDLLICYRGTHLEGVFLTGLWTKRATVAIRPGTKIFGVQFRLLAIENIIQKSIAPIINNIKELEKTYWGLDTVSNNVDSELFEYINKYLLSIIEHQKEEDSRKYTLLNLINQSKGNRTVDYYSKQVFWSRRQINRYFQSNFGLSLKSYCTILKCASSFSPIKKGELYPTQNYFDRPHFTKEVKKITGYRPKDLAKNENDRFLQLSIIKND